MPDMENPEEVPLPEWSEAALQAMSPGELIDCLIASDAQVPSSLIEACASRGSDMVEALRKHLDVPWEDDVTAGEYWLRLHACMILGRMPEEGAGFFLNDCIRRMSGKEDSDLLDWFAGRWQALYANKPATVLTGLREFAVDRTANWYGRVGAIEALLVLARHHGAPALETALEWAAGIAGDEAEDWDLRISVADLLLDHPRASYRPLLEAMATGPNSTSFFFDMDEIAKVYARQRDALPRERSADPWSFYAPEKVRERQQERAQADEQADEQADGNVEDEFDDEFEMGSYPLPYVRDEPKIGRNDPCPCGSGRKFKKCCLDKPGLLSPSP